MTSMDTLLAGYDAFRRSVAATPDLDIRTRTTFRPITPEQLAAIGARRGALPGALVELLSTPFESVAIEDVSGERLYASAVFLDAAGILRGLEVSDRVADDLASVEPELAERLRHSIPLQEESNAWHLDTASGAVWKVSFDGEPGVEVADDFATAFAHWVEAGCFDCGGANVATFAAYWAKVGGFVPGSVPPAENLWLRALGRYYGQPTFPTGGKALSKKPTSKKPASKKGISKKGISKEVMSPKATSKKAVTAKSRAKKAISKKATTPKATSKKAAPKRSGAKKR